MCCVCCLFAGFWWLCLLVAWLLCCLLLTMVCGLRCGGVRFAFGGFGVLDGCLLFVSGVGCVIFCFEGVVVWFGWLMYVLRVEIWLTVSLLWVLFYGVVYCVNGVQLSFTVIYG